MNPSSAYRLTALGAKPFHEKGKGSFLKASGLWVAYNSKSAQFTNTDKLIHISILDTSPYGGQFPVALISLNSKSAKNAECSLLAPYGSSSMMNIE